MKSSLTAVRLVYNYLLSIDAKKLTNIKGNIYWLNRPLNSKSEDIVVSSLAMNAEALQEGVINVNVHVPNLSLQGDGTQPDFIRLEQLANILLPLLANVWGDSYNFKIDAPGEPVPAGDHWFLNIRIRFWVLR